MSGREMDLVRDAFESNRIAPPGPNSWFLVEYNRL